MLVQCFVFWRLEVLPTVSVLHPHCGQLGYTAGLLIDVCTPKS